MFAHAGETVSRQVPQNRRRDLLTHPPLAAEQLSSRWNTLRTFSGRERRRCRQIVCRSRMALLGQTPGRHDKRNGMEDQVRHGLEPGGPGLRNEEAQETAAVHETLALSSTSRTFCARALGVKGFGKKQRSVSTPPTEKTG